MAQITCKDLILGYEGRVIAQNINFEVEQGDYLCIVGENGAGKSTLIKALLGLNAPLYGEIKFENSISGRDIGYLPQQSLAQRDFPATVWEIVLSGCVEKGFWKFRFSKESRNLARANLEKLGIWDIRKESYRNLSGGQQQRVLLARALCATGDMLLLDEPASGLDPKVSAELYALIEKLNKEEKITVVMISHDIYSAIKYSSHILHIGHTPLFFGKTEDYTASQIGRVFVDFSKKEESTNE